MKRTLAAAFLLLVANVVVGSEPKLDQPISLTLRDAVAADVFKSFGQFLSVDVEIDPEIDGLLTIQLEDVSARTALQASCESLGCEWQLEDGALHLTAVEPRLEEHSTPKTFEPLDIELKDAGAAEFFHSLGQILEAEVDLDPTVNGTFSIKLEHADLDEIMREVCAKLDCVAGLGLVERNGSLVLEVRARKDS